MYDLLLDLIVNTMLAKQCHVCSSWNWVVTEFMVFLLCFLCGLQLSTCSCFNAISVLHANNPGVNTTELFFLFLLFHCSSHSNKLITCSYSILQQKKFRSCNLVTKHKLIVIIYLQKKIVTTKK